MAGVVERGEDIELVRHPYALLHLARALEPGQRLVRRTAALGSACGYAFLMRAPKK